MKILKYPHPILRTPCQPVAKVSKEITKLAKDMIQCMAEHDGVGLAAPQIGQSIRMFVVDIWWTETGSTTKALTFINPKITPLGKETQRGREGCLSLPGIDGFVTRYSKIRVEALDANGKAFSLEAEGFLAVAIQHEYDHLEGLTMIERLGPTARRMVKKQLET